MTKVFISYAHADGFEIVKELAARLQENNRYKVFRDYEVFRGGDHVEATLLESIKWCDIFIVVVTDAYHTSKWVFWEFERARKFKKKILPIQIDGTPLPVYLEDYFAIGYSGKSEEILRKIDFVREQIEWQKIILRYTIIGIIGAVLIIFLLAVNILGIRIFDTCSLTNSCDVANLPFDNEVTSEATVELIETLTPIPQSAILYSEDFEDGIAYDFEPMFDGWSIVEYEGNKVYQGRSTGSWIYTAVGSQDWDNYTVAFRMKVLERGTTITQASVSIRSIGNAREYLLDMSTSRNTATLILSLPTLNNPGWEYTIISEPTENIQLYDGNWNNIRIEVNGNLISATVNEVLLWGYDDTYSSGEIHLAAAPNAIVLFDDIQVWSMSE
jgi:hypothetical protein